MTTKLSSRKRDDGGREVKNFAAIRDVIYGRSLHIDDCIRQVIRKIGLGNYRQAMVRIPFSFLIQSNLCCAK